MSTTAVRRLEVRVVGDARDLSRTFSTVGREAGKVETGAKKAGVGLGVMARAATGAVAALGASGLVRSAVGAANAASDLGESVTKTEQVFKGSAPTIKRWSETTASSIGVSKRAALEAAGVFGNMLVPMGIARDRAAELSRGMVNLAGDLASFNNASPEEVLEALRAGLAGETEPLRRFGVFLNAARVEAEAMSLGLVKATRDTDKIRSAQLRAEVAQQRYTKAVREHGEASAEAKSAEAGLIAANSALEKATKGSTGEISAAAKAQATYSLIMKDTKDAQGDFARTSDGLANQQRILAAEWENAQAALGEQLLPVMIRLVGTTRDAIGFVREHGDTLREVGKYAAIAGAGVAAYTGYVRAAAATSAVWSAISAGMEGVASNTTRAAAATAATTVATTAASRSAQVYAATFLSATSQSRAALAGVSRSAQVYAETFGTASASTVANAGRTATGIGRIGSAAAGAGRSVSTFAVGAGRALTGLAGGPVGLAVAATTLLAGVVLKLRDGETWAARATRESAAALREATDASRARAAAAEAQRAALDGLRGANLNVEDAQLRVEEAAQRAADAEKQYGRGSLEARRAALDLRRAQLDLRDARRAQRVEAEKQDDAAGKSAKAIRDEVTAAKEAVRENERRAAAARLGVITGEQAERVTKDYAASQRRLNEALSAAADRHRANARRAREQADAIKGATPRAEALRRKLRELAEVETRRAQTRELEAGLAALERKLPGVVRQLSDVVSMTGGSIGGLIPPTRAMGGFVPGRRGRPVPIIAHAGEVVLNPEQQREVGIDRIVGALRRTGGIVGGDGAAFGRGGFVNPVPGGSWKYGPGGGTHSRREGNPPYLWQDDDAWDVMASNGTPVYAGFAGTIGRVSGFNRDPRYWGHGVYLQGAPGTLFYKHLRDVAVRPGQQVTAGTLLGHLGVGVNGGPHLHLAARPIGLLASLRAGGPPGAGGDGEEGRSTKEEQSPLRTLTRALVGSGAFRGKAAGTLARALTSGRSVGAILGRRGASIEATSERVEGGSLTDVEQRRVDAAGRRARRAARAAGLSPDEVARAGEEAERKAEVTALKKHVRQIDRARRNLKAEQRALNRRLAKLRKAKNAKPGTKRVAARAIIAQLRRIARELRELAGIRAEVMGRLAELQEAAEGEAYDAAWTGGEGGEGDEGPTEDDFLNAAAAQAALTPGLEDDLAAAQAIEAKAQRDYDAAVASGDPRRIADTAGALLQARQNREQIEATMRNTDALEANTAALRESFGGSSVFDFRGQQWVLRSLAPPSSDRLETIGLGV